MSKYSKAIAAFLAGVLTTIGGWTATIQTNAPEMVTTSVAVLGAIQTFVATLLVYVAPKNTPETS